MKHVNFITTLSPQQQYEIRRWFILSALIIIITIIALSCYFAPQFYSLYAIKKEISLLQKKTKNYTSYVNNRDSLKKENQILQQKKTKINNHLLIPKNPFIYITTIINACTNSTVEQIKNNKKNIEMIILCPTTESATTLMQHLANTDYFIDTKIISLQQHDKNKQFKCTIKGIIKK